MWNCKFPHVSTVMWPSPNWELFTILERFTETSHTEASHYAGIGSSSQRYSARIAVTLIFKKIMA